MAKIALICDTHLGCRSDAKAFLDNQVKFMENIFFPTLDKENIHTVVHLGDVFDRRKYVNFVTANSARKHMFQPMFDRGMDIHVILGNHDCTYKNTNEINCMKELYGDSSYADMIKIYENSEVINIDGLDILMLPWICDSNREMSYDMIKKSKATIVMGHLELFGFEMYRGAFAEHGIDHKIFSNYDMVFSGHYHHKSTTKNIYYLGSTGQYTWSDYGDTRGFHIFDTATRELTFIMNPYPMYNKYVYDDIAKTPETMLNFDTSSFDGTYVKIVVKNKKDPYLLERVIDKFNKSNILNLQIIEDVLQLGFEGEMDDVVDETEDTLTILKKHIDMSSYHNKTGLEKFVVSLYNEALEHVN